MTFTTDFEIREIVFIPNLEAEGIITRIAFDADGVLYLVSWLANSRRQTEYLYPHEIRKQK